MIKKAALSLFLNIILCSLTWTQNSETHPIGRMEHRADSVAKVIDNLISSGTFLHLVMESKEEGDTTIHYRQYFIDTLNRYLMKSIIDTSFEDYYKRNFKQSVIYFNQGYEFKSSYSVGKGDASDICSYYNIYPEKNEIAQQKVKLNMSWTKETIDEKIRQHLRTEIYHVKLMQKKHSKQN